MKKQFLTLSLLIFAILTLTFSSCKKENSITSPILSTTSIISINKTNSFCSGYITSDGGSKVTERGFCWSTSQNPTIINSTKSIDDSVGIGNFLTKISGLTCNTIYYIRPYAINSSGASYGDEKSFKTLIDSIRIKNDCSLHLGTINIVGSSLIFNNINANFTTNYVAIPDGIYSLSGDITTNDFLLNDETNGSHKWSIIFTNNISAPNNPDIKIVED